MSKFLGAGVPFYYGSYEKIIAMFYIAFSNIIIYSEGNEIRVPLVYAPREKFLSKLIGKPHDNDVRIDSVLPRMGFEDISFAFATERGLNAIECIESFNVKTQEATMFNRVPYDLDIDLIIEANKKEEGLRIIEQIIPSFNPTLNVTIPDIIDFDLTTDIQIKLNSSSSAIEYEGTFTDRRTLTWTLSFTIEMFFYCPYDHTQRIKHAILNMSANDIQNVLTQIRFDVVPETANRDDDHEIVETITEDF